MTQPTGDATTGIWLMCLCVGLPYLLGALTGWALRGRVITMGLPWAFLPSFAKHIYQRILEYGE